MAALATDPVSRNPKNAALLKPPHSPPPAATFKSHWGTNSRLASFHERLAVCAKVAAGLVPTYTPSLAAYCQYFARLALMAVLPLPNTS